MSSVSEQNIERIVYITDLHLRSSTPSSRKDNYLEQTLKVLDWVFRYATRIKATAIVCGGDLGHRWDWKISLINQAATVFKKYSIPFYTVIGNHDIPGKNYDVLPDTAIYLLAKLGIIKLISTDLNTPTTIGRFELHGFNADTPHTENLLAGKISVPDSDNVKVAVIHAAVGAENTPYCRGIKTLFIPDFDFACFGDIHTGWPTFKSLTDCIMVNPGAATKLTKAEIGRVPKLVILNSDKTFKEVRLPYFKDEEMFDLEKLKEEEASIGNQFIISLASRETTYQDPIQYVKTIAKKSKISKPALELLLAEIKVK